MISFFNFFDSLNIVINLSRSTNSKLEDGLGFVICIIIIPLIEKIHRDNLNKFSRIIFFEFFRGDCFEEDPFLKRFRNLMH